MLKKISRKRVTNKTAKCDPTSFSSKDEHEVTAKTISTLNSDHKVSNKQKKNVHTVKGIITEFCSDSTVHGFKYIGDHRRPIIERIVWTFFLILSTYYCFHLIKTNWDIRKSRPVIITFDERLTPIWDIPFPTVTICPDTKTNPYVFNQTAAIERYQDFRYVLTAEEENYIEVLAQTCTNERFKFYHPWTPSLSNDSEWIDIMTRLSFDDMAIDGLYRGLFDAQYYSYKVLTEEGLCYSFNSVDPKSVYREEALVAGTFFVENDFKKSEWSLERGYNNMKSQAYPFRTSLPGLKDGLTVTLTGDPEKSDPLCQGPSQGFKLIVSTPGEIPQISDIFISIPFNQQVTVSIKPEIVSSSEGLRQYDPDSRQCYFQDERYLKYFKIYTQANCELECISNRTLEQCNCTRFHMPRTESLPVCRRDSFDCQSSMKTNEFYGDDALIEDLSECNCLPTCRTIQYKAELEDISPLLDKEYFEIEKNNSATKLTVSFKEKSFKALMRSERYTFTDFIASCGGLLGLSMGVSILSVVELLSFLTIRLWVNLRTSRRKKLELKKRQEADRNA